MTGRLAQPTKKAATLAGAGLNPEFDPETRFLI